MQQLFSRISELFTWMNFSGLESGTHPKTSIIHTKNLPRNKESIRDHLLQKYEDKVCNPDISQASLPPFEFEMCPSECSECFRKPKIYEKLNKSGLLKKWNKSQTNSIGESFLAELNDN